MDWLTLAGSLAAVFALAGIAWWMGVGAAPKIADRDQAMTLAGDAHSGFRPAEAAVDHDGRAAIVIGEDNSIILLRPHGAQIAARVFHAMPRVERSEGELKIHSGERMFGDVTLTLNEAEAARWEARLKEPNRA